jgi:hypothetical protein
MRTSFMNWDEVEMVWIALSVQFHEPSGELAKFPPDTVRTMRVSSEGRLPPAGAVEPEDPEKGAAAPAQRR